MVPKQYEKYIERKHTVAFFAPTLFTLEFNEYRARFAVYGRGQEECLTYDDADMFNEDSIIMKTEQMTDEEELDDDHYSDMSDAE